MASRYGDMEEEKESSGSLVPFSILFAPALLISLFFNLYLHRKKRLRPSVIWRIIAAYEVVILAIWLLTSAHSKFFAALMNLGEIKERWFALAWPLLLFYMMAAGIFGAAWVVIEKRQLAREPHRRELKGNWMYHFKYKRTPREVSTRKKRINQLKADMLVDQDRVPLGIDEDNHDEIVYRYYDEAVKHTLIAGASGSGKTLFSMLSLIRGDIENRVPTFIIDFKRDPELAAKVATWTKEAGGDFYHFVNGDKSSYDIPCSLGQSYYDPLGTGGPTAKADMVLGMREYDTASAVYKAAMTQLLQVLFQMLVQADKTKTNSVKWHEGGISQLASVANEVGFQDLIAGISETAPIAPDAAAVADAIKPKSSQLRHALDELAGQIRTIAVSEYGHWLKPKGNPGERLIDLFSLSQKPGSVVLFSLNSDSEPDFAKYVGSLILADITNVSARRRNENMNNMVSVYVDEFQIVPPTAVTSLLEKSRASSMGLTLAQQSFEQIVSSAPSNGEAYLLSILDTCSNFIVHNGSTEDSAERLAKILGKHQVTKYRSSNKNESFFLSLNWRNKREAMISTSEEEEWVFAPREFMTLMSPSEGNGYKATAVLVNKTSSDPRFQNRAGAIARKVWMIPAEDQLRKYYSVTGKMDAGMNDAPADVLRSQAPVEHVPAPPVLDAGEELLRRRREGTPAPAYEPPRVEGFEFIEEPLQDEDDAWGFEAVDDSEDLKDTIDQAYDAPPQPSLPTQERRRASFFDGPPVPQTAPRPPGVKAPPKPAPTPVAPREEPEEESLPGLPTLPATPASRPNGGLPTRPIPAPPRDPVDEDQALPPL